VTDKDRFAQLIYYVAVILVGYLAFQVVQPFLVPLGWAGVLAVCVYPIHARGIRRLGRSRAAAWTTVLVLVLLVLPVWLVVSALVSEGAQAAAAVKSIASISPPQSIVNAWNWLQSHVPFLAGSQIMSIVSGAGQKLVGALASASGSILGGLALVILDLFITLFALFFFLRDGEGIANRIRSLLPFGEDQRERVLKQVADLIYASVIAGLAVAAVQGLLGGLAFWVLGLHAPVVWGTIMGLFSLIPVAGAWVIWFPVAVWLMATGDVTRGIILTAIGVGLVGTADNILRPMLLSGRSAMNGLVTFIALLGGVAAFGFIGLIFGPVVIAVAMALFDAYLSPSASSTTDQKRAS
jgi:predicted PurR-regulated permease PerM